MSCGDICSFIKKMLFYKEKNKEKNNKCYFIKKMLFYKEKNKEKNNVIL